MLLALAIILLILALLGGFALSHVIFILAIVALVLFVLSFRGRTV